MRKIKGDRKTDIIKQLKEVDKLFAGFSKEKTLPTFEEFFMQCMILGIAEQVNLKLMYPKVYKKLHSFLEHHNNKFLAIRK